MTFIADQKKEPVYGFLHVAMHGPWQSIVTEQLAKISASGLYEQCQRLFMVLLGPSPEEFRLRTPKIEIIHTSPDYHEYEFPALEFMHQFSHKNDGKFFYIHTKGVFAQSAFTQDWRRYMEYFVIERYRDCLEALEKYDVCGVNWQEYRER